MNNCTYVKINFELTLSYKLKTFIDSKLYRQTEQVWDDLRW